MAPSERVDIDVTWDELANIYDREHPGNSRPARTLPMDTVFDWAKQRPDLFKYRVGSGTLHLKKKESK